MITREGYETEPEGPPSSARSLADWLRLCIRFYLGLGAPCVWRTYPDGRVRAASSQSADLVHALVSAYAGKPAPPSLAGKGADADLRTERINFRCARITLIGLGESFFVKEFPRLRAWHDLERWVKCSRVDRAWRAGHLLPSLGLLTPRPRGTAQLREDNGLITEYLVTEWLESATPFPRSIAGADARERAAMLREFAQHMCLWHVRGVYLRDLAKNVLVRSKGGARQYWLTDLDGLHPLRRPTRSRMLRQMRQFGHWAKPGQEEAQLIAQYYLREGQAGSGRGKMQAIVTELLSAAD